MFISKNVQWIVLVEFAGMLVQGAKYSMKHFFPSFS